MEDIKYWIQDKFEEIKKMFQKSSSSKFSLEWLSDSLEQSWKLFLIIWILWLCWFFYVFFWKYMLFKQTYINWKIQVENNRILQKAKEKKENDKELYKSVQEQVIQNKWFNIWDLVCYFDNFDKRKIDYVNRWYKLQKIDFDEEEQSFDIILQWIRKYNSLTDLLVLLKQYKTLIDLESYDVELVKEKVWLWEIDYYNVSLKWKILN